MNKLNCIGWVYDYGYQDENLIGRETVGQDISTVIRDIVDWEWDNDCDVMAASITGQVYKSIGWFKTALRDMESKGIKDNDIVYTLIEDLLNLKLDF
jgi:hypothetical protein